MASGNLTRNKTIKLPWLLIIEIEGMLSAYRLLAYIQAFIPHNSHKICQTHQQLLQQKKLQLLLQK
jgi:hypothetical protein